MPCLAVPAGAVPHEAVSGCGRRMGGRESGRPSGSRTSAPDRPAFVDVSSSFMGISASDQFSRPRGGCQTPFQRHRSNGTVPTRCRGVGAPKVATFKNAHRARWERPVRFHPVIRERMALRGCRVALRIHGSPTNQRKVCLNIAREVRACFRGRRTRRPDPPPGPAPGGPSRLSAQASLTGRSPGSGVRATARAVTRRQPAARRQRAAASRVAPVVVTSSTRIARSGGRR